MRLKSKVLERFKGYERSNEIVSASPSGFRDNAVPATTSYLSALAATPALNPEYPMGLEKENLPKSQFRTLLNGVLSQDKDLCTESQSDMKVVTTAIPTANEYADLVFANKLVKHTKSNAIVFAKNGQMLASGTGQTSRLDALNQAIVKAEKFGFDLRGAVMASDAFFPFADCVEIAGNVGINAVIQPGGSIKDKDSIAYCDLHKIAMVFTGNRHFKH